MKAITIRQPWASLIATGDKLYETRTWATKYRGPIAIHAGKQMDNDAFMFLVSPLATIEHLKACGIKPDNLTLGAVIAIADLVNVWHIVHHPGTNVDEAKHIPVGAESLSTDKHAPDFGDYFVPTEKEMAFGYWVPGNYAWELRNVRILPAPVPAKGKQGLWDWEPPHICGTCEYWEEFQGVCFNGGSEHCADFINGSDCCDRWENRKEHKA